MINKRNLWQLGAILLVFALLFVPGSSAINPIIVHVEKTVFQHHSALVSVNSYADDELLVRLRPTDLEFSHIKIDQQVFIQPSLAGESQINDKGKPNLPMLSRSVLVPHGFQVELEVVDASFVEYDEMQIAPSKGVVSRAVSLESVPFSFANTYEQNKWFPSDIVRLGESYQIRDVTGQVVQFFPCQYHPINNRLRVYTEVVVRISFVSDSPGSSLRSIGLYGSIDQSFYQVYQRRFLNAPVLQQYDPVMEEGGLLIITDDMFYDALQSFVSWKIKKGIPTWVVNVSETQNAAPAIKNVIQQFYEEHQISYVLLVGDAQQITTFHTTAGYASDPMYTYLVGDDHYPDVFIGRFSAQTIEDLQTQITRTMQYEQSAEMHDGFYRQASGIASNESGDGGDDGESDSEHIRIIRRDLLNYTYSVVDELYDGTNGGADEPGNPIPDDIASVLNQGRGLVTYCGHGSSLVWGTGDFAISDIYELTNTNKLPFIWSVSCWNGDFENYNACFAEAWLRATYQGEPVGAVATFMSSSAQAWNPPMAAQDEMVDLLVETYENYTPRSFGALCYSGCMKMNDEYGSSGYFVTDTWHVFGDPSLQIRTNTPISLLVSHQSYIHPDDESFTVDVAGVKPAQCTLSYLGKILGKQQTNSTTGVAEILLTEPLPDRGILDLVVTGYNAIPYQTTIPIDAENTPPRTPSRPRARRILFTNRTYQFHALTTDPDNDLIFYQWDWGDAAKSTWIGPYNSGDVCIENHEYNSSGLMTIRVRVKDAYNVTSDWSDPLHIPVISSFLKQRTILLQILERFFPRIYELYTSQHEGRV